jgi:hypothetical protein
MNDYSIALKRYCFVIWEGAEMCPHSKGLPTGE